MLRFTPCACGTQYLVRLDRHAWMRLVPTRRHYFCAKCKETQFVPRHAGVSWWLPSTRAELDENAASPPTRGSRR